MGSIFDLAMELMYVCLPKEMNMSVKKPNEKSPDEEVKDDFEEIRQFLKKKKIQNDVLKKLMDKPDLGLSENKNPKK